MAREDVFESIEASYGKNFDNYIDIFKKVQDIMSNDVRSSSNSQLEENNATELISTILRKIGINDDEKSLSKKLYHDIAKYSFISYYGIFDMEGFEELNINAWNDVDMIISGRMFKTEYSFLSSSHALDIISKLLSKTSKTIDNTTPVVETDLEKGIRVTVIKPPVVDKNIGIAASIRKVSATTQTIEDVVKGGSITEEMLRLLVEAGKAGVAICFAGETGSGKTFLAGAILRELAKTQRIYTIEENSREWDLIDFDEEGRPRNSVIHTKTRPDKDPQRNISQNKLLETALRFDPKVIGVGEMRSEEAYAACEAAITGHTVITTTHANSAEETPSRIVGLMKKAHDFSDLTLMRLAVEGFRLLVFLGKLPDGTRKVKQIAEAIGVDKATGEAIVSVLYKFEVEDNIYTEVNDGVHRYSRIKSIGSFRHINGISERLKQRMLDGGATKDIVNSFSVPAEGGCIE